MKSVLVISSRDNVATALVPLAPGTRLDVTGGLLIVRDAIPPGHKVALATIAAGEPVIKYGSAIGTASAEIAAGVHVHTHNLSSNRGRGDLAPAQETADTPGSRLAEPVDERAERLEVGDSDD